uniref:Anthranilate synthase component 2 n=1 Tax=Porphyra purpurea TaxID=2787 RepID=TRPG_PORPU|nr:anthranilate synthase component 2 [Porphyra purpurea]P51362.1 RecName: Full=Anthranilate synthase component 2; Short=AS; AltName: Full=Anthranilate synthase, glutamine amidotransferase component [Porphyra purpurea]AAC08248.1 anthranilate synthase component II [Porphyra purpurea]
MILIIDNYDSFTYNLAQCVGELGHDVLVCRNDEIDVVKIKKLNPEKIIISPGPGKPTESGISLDVISSLAEYIPILGVCLGHQSIGYINGGSIIKVPKIMHGKTSQIYHDREDLFINLPNPFIATRYHSLIIDRANFPTNLAVTAWTDNNIIMACRHKHYKMLRGIQFHPESLWTVCGQQLLKNFLDSD